MDKNRDDKLELDKNMNDFSSDDDIESLLISSSSATDALSALSFDKKSHTLRIRVKTMQIKVLIQQMKRSELRT